MFNSLLTLQIVIDETYFFYCPYNSKEVCLAVFGAKYQYRYNSQPKWLHIAKIGDFGDLAADFIRALELCPRI